MLGVVSTSDQVIEEVTERVPMCTRCTRVRFDDVWRMPVPAAIAALEGTNTFARSICAPCVQALMNEEALDP
jgi:hypothetical protein